MFQSALELTIDENSYNDLNGNKRTVVIVSKKYIACIILIAIDMWNIQSYYFLQFVIHKESHTDVGIA